MKTITLTDEAYQRIAVLKVSPKDSFSKVILRSVAKRGTAAQILAGVRKLPALTDEQASLMLEAVREQNNPKNQRDPWTTS